MSFADLAFRFAVIPAMGLWAIRRLASELRTLWQELIEGGTYRW